MGQRCRYCLYSLILARTVACRYADSSIANIARVDATQQYKEMSQRLSRNAATHLGPPYRNAEEMPNMPSKTHTAVPRVYTSYDLRKAQRRRSNLEE